MNKSWRPKDWKNQYDCSTCDCEPEGCPGCGTNAYEAGAEAMLKAIIQTLMEVKDDKKS